MMRNDAFESLQEWKNDEKIQCKFSFIRKLDNNSWNVILTWKSRVEENEETVKKIDENNAWLNIIKLLRRNTKGRG